MLTYVVRIRNFLKASDEIYIGSSSKWFPLLVKYTTTLVHKYVPRKMYNQSELKSIHNTNESSVENCDYCFLISYIIMTFFLFNLNVDLEKY